jgi:hypothetical protein
VARTPRAREVRTTHKRRRRTAVTTPTGISQLENTPHHGSSTPNAGFRRSPDDPRKQGHGYCAPVLLGSRQPVATRCDCPTIGPSGGRPGSKRAVFTENASGPEIFGEVSQAVVTERRDDQLRRGVEASVRRDLRRDNLYPPYLTFGGCCPGRTRITIGVSSMAVGARNGPQRVTDQNQRIRRRIRMGKIVATEYVSLDGVVEAPGGSEPAIEG